MVLNRWAGLVTLAGLATAISGCGHAGASNATARVTQDSPLQLGPSQAQFVTEDTRESQTSSIGSSPPESSGVQVPVPSADTNAIGRSPITGGAALPDEIVKQAEEALSDPRQAEQFAERLVALSGGSSEDDSSKKKFPGYLTKYDLMTDVDSFFIRYLDPTAVGTLVKDWPLVTSILGMGVKLIDADIIADHLNTAIPVEGQPEFKHVQDIIDDCAQVLGVKAPALFVKADPKLNAYVTRLDEPHLLVLTSGLYNLYENRPDELRFIIGHELGHLKCGHIRCHTVGRFLMTSLLGDSDKGGFKETYVAPLLIGQLLRWYRESEMSADRAGMICIGGKQGDSTVAKQALQRLLHGTNKNVDPKKVQMQEIQFEKEPFVKIIRKLKGYGQDHPFVPDRCSALDQWILSAEYARLMERPKVTPSESLLVIDEIHVKNLPDVGSGVGFNVKPKPIIAAVFGDSEQKSGAFGKEPNPSLTDLGWKFPYLPGCRLIIEVTDYNSVLSNQFVGSCILPVSQSSNEVKGELRLDIKKAVSNVNLPPVAVKYHMESKK